MILLGGEMVVSTAMTSPEKVPTIWSLSAVPRELMVSVQFPRGPASRPMANQFSSQVLDVPGMSRPYHTRPSPLAQMKVPGVDVPGQFNTNWRPLSTPLPSKTLPNTLRLFSFLILKTTVASGSSKRSPSTNQPIVEQLRSGPAPDPPPPATP